MSSGGGSPGLTMAASPKHRPRPAAPACGRWFAGDAAGGTVSYPRAPSWALSAQHVGVWMCVCETRRVRRDCMCCMHTRQHFPIAVCVRVIGGRRNRIISECTCLRVCCHECAPNPYVHACLCACVYKCRHFQLMRCVCIASGRAASMRLYCCCAAAGRFFGMIRRLYTTLPLVKPSNPE